MTENFYVKIVRAKLKIGEKPEYTSITKNELTVTYEPDTWIEPIMRGTKLFMFQRLNDAFQFFDDTRHRYQPVFELPFDDYMLWWCLANNAEIVKTPIFSDLTKGAMVQYWRNYPKPVSDLKGRFLAHPSWSVIVADAIKLVYPVTVEEIERITGRKYAKQVAT